MYHKSKWDHDCQTCLYLPPLHREIQLHVLHGTVQGAHVNKEKCIIQYLSQLTVAYNVKIKHAVCYSGKKLEADTE